MKVQIPYNHFMKIGPYTLDNNIILAPMAGVTDRPFRILSKRLGAGMVVGEMVSANPQLLKTRKTQLRLNHDGEAEPIAVQIEGGDVELLEQSAIFNVNNGAQIIDINMGCPAKKVCNKAAGSALMKDERLVREILEAVVSAVDIPVTLKIRTGWSRDNKNALTVAKMAESIGIQSLAVHGRTREDKYLGEAEYDTIAEIKSALSIPVIANGDIDTPQKAKQVLDYTKADGIMIGRQAQGRPWIFREIDHFLKTGETLPEIQRTEAHSILKEHVIALHEFYGDYLGLRIARKHVGWYLQTEDNAKSLRQQFNRIECPKQQIKMLEKI